MASSSTTTKGTVLITGANGALGSAIVQQIVSSPEFSAYHGLYTARDVANAPALTAALSRGRSHHADTLALDLTDLDDVRKVASSINVSGLLSPWKEQTPEELAIGQTRISAGEIPPIRALILNAGFLDFGKQSWTKDGLDTTFAANYLGHWLLTLLLLKSIDKKSGRILIIGSQAHDPGDPRNAAGGAFNAPQYKTFLSDVGSFHAIAKGEWSPASEDASFRGGFRRYGAAKLFLVMMQHEPQARLDADPQSLGNVCVLGLDPGTMISGLQRLAPWFIRVLLFRWVYPLILYLKPDGGPIRPTSRSASDALELVFGAGYGESGELPKDKYFNGRTPMETSQESRDPFKRELVWGETAKLAALKVDDTALSQWR